MCVHEGLWCKDAGARGRGVAAFSNCDDLENILNPFICVGEACRNGQGTTCYLSAGRKTLLANGSGMNNARYQHRVWRDYMISCRK